MSHVPHFLTGPQRVRPTDPNAVEEYFGSLPRMARARRMVEEIARLNTSLDQERANLAHIQSFLNYHGGAAVWDSDQILRDQEQILARSREESDRLLGNAQSERSQTLADARQTAAQAVTEARNEAAKIVSEAQQEAEELRRSADMEVTRVQADTENIRQEANELRSIMPQLRIDSAVSVTALEEFAHPAERYVTLQSELRSLRARMKRDVSDDSAIEGAGWMPSTPADQRKLTRNIRKLMVRCFNIESEKTVRGATATNVDASLNKIHSSADALERLASPMGFSIAAEYQKYKVDELELAVKVEAARKIEQEAQRERRAELKEQARIDAEMEAQRARLEKERSHYENLLQKIRDLGDESRAGEVQNKLAEIEVGIADVEFRQANHRAGYVYVISNVGAFGERMVKIGLTRRLDPMDRVKELGDASVPFGFDVHALFFSDDAVNVESELHRRFADRRVNRINNRREFFYATPAEVRGALQQIQGDLLEFVEVPEAEQYRASLILMDS